MSSPCAETMPAVTVPPRPKRVADRDNPVAVARLAIGERDEWKALALDFDEGKVGELIRPDDLGGMGFTVDGRHLYGGRVVDDMIVGHGVAVRRDEKARAQARDYLAGAWLFRRLEATEDLLERRRFLGGRRLFHPDAYRDDGGFDFGDQVSKPAGWRRWFDGVNPPRPGRQAHVLVGNCAPDHRNSEDRCRGEKSQATGGEKPASCLGVGAALRHGALSVLSGVHAATSDADIGHARHGLSSFP